MKKIKILTLSDHPLSPSGVGTQTKYMIEALLKTGRYSFICLGGAVKHNDYTPVKVEPYSDDWVIYPIDGYGNHDVVRSVIQKEKPDVVWFMTDPRFYEWLWEIDNEIRANVPMMYYHVWDNYPYPKFNKRYYDSNDHVACISKVTHDIVDTVSEVDNSYIPHAVNSSFYNKHTSKELKERVARVRENVLSESQKAFPNTNKKLFFWNNRNARRKQSGTLIWWFKEFLDEVGHDKAALMMHTDARDPHGQDLPHIMNELGLTKGQVMLSTNKVQPDELALVYNAADFTINISDAEGFGLATLESLACGTPIIVNMTGGLQEQVTNGKEWFGWGIKPASSSIIGSLQVPYIYEDRISKEDFINVMKKAIKLPKAKYDKMSKAGINHVKENYNFEDFENSWIKLMDEFVEKNGSWETRKNYQRWSLLEVA